jgi:hypothetical protein
MSYGKRPRNGQPRSDRLVVTEHFIRDGENLTIMAVIRDPAYLTDHSPLRATTSSEPCCVRASGIMPETNKFLDEFPAKHGLPPQAAPGGADTMYPEYLGYRVAKYRIRAAQATLHPSQREYNGIEAEACRLSTSRPSDAR